jgi:mannose-1-phosphate guanylyltransferase / mannose-6-phosphate isomerase
VRIVHENESVYVPIGSQHRLENPGKIDLELIEVQTGSYLGEDDIERIQDDYNRS